jgi:hypothetical protein
MDTISVVYLSWIPYGIEEMNAFVKSYKEHSAGVPHQLTIIFNGVHTDEDYQPFLKIAEDELENRFTYFILEKGQDIDAYLFVTRKLKSDYLFFLNTYSRILAENWLRKFVKAFEDPQIGLVSATASAMSYYSAVFQKNSWKWYRKQSLFDEFRKYKLMIKALLYWRFLFKPFPNYHIRTNAFMIKRETMLRIQCPLLDSKFKAYLFESGHMSLTNQVLKMNLSVRMMDRNGQLYEMKDWAHVPVFWNDKQQLLLIKDNQTNKYASALPEEQQFMSYLAWGKRGKS